VPQGRGDNANTSPTLGGLLDETVGKTHGGSGMPHPAGRSPEPKGSVQEGSHTPMAPSQGSPWWLSTPPQRGLAERGGYPRGS